MANSKQNIFTYATSELSQDAFIAWLCANYDSNKLGELSKKFIGLLADEKEWAKISDVEVEKQHNHIDVLVLYKIDGNQKVLVIEDKTFTGEHDNQIVRYVTEIKKEYKDKELLYNDFSCAYYKTGHIFNNPVDEDINDESERKHLENIEKELTAEKDENGEENKARIKSFKIIGLDEICEFFGKFTKDEIAANDILQNYVGHIETLKADFASEVLPSANESKFELKENLDIWMNFYDSIYTELKEEFKDLKFPFFNYDSYYASIEVESNKFSAPRLEFRSRESGLLRFYFHEWDEKKAPHRVNEKRDEKKDKLFLEKYKAEYGSSVSVNNRKEPKQFFKLSNSDAKTTKEEFKSFIKKVAEFYQKAVNEIYSEAI